MFSLGMIKRQRRRIFARGGVEYNVGDFRYHVFTASGSLQVFVGGTMQVTLVGGGGGGGNSTSGGGGAGGIYYIPQMPIGVGTYQLTVGTGGAGGVYTGATVSTSSLAKRGGDTIGFGYVAKGGGAGGGSGNPGYGMIATATWQGYYLGESLTIGGSGGGSSFNTSTQANPNRSTSTLVSYSGYPVVYALGTPGESHNLPHTPSEGGIAAETGGSGGGAGRSPLAYQPYGPQIGVGSVVDSGQPHCAVAQEGGSGIAVKWGAPTGTNTTTIFDYVLLGGGGGGGGTHPNQDGNTNNYTMWNYFGGSHGTKTIGWSAPLQSQPAKNGTGGGGGAGGYGGIGTYGFVINGSRGGDGIILIKYAQSSRSGIPVEPPLTDPAEVMVVGGGGGGAQYAYDNSPGPGGGGGEVQRSLLWPVLGAVYTGTIGAGGSAGGWLSAGYAGNTSTFLGPDIRGYNLDLRGWGGGGGGQPASATQIFKHAGGSIAGSNGGFPSGSVGGSGPWGPSSGGAGVPGHGVYLGGQGMRYYGAGGYGTGGPAVPAGWDKRRDWTQVRYGQGVGGNGGYGGCSSGKPGSFLIRLPERYTIENVIGLNYDITYWDGAFCYNFIKGSGTFQISNNLFDTTGKILIDYLLVGGGGGGGVGTTSGGGGGAGGYIRCSAWVNTNTQYALGVGAGGTQAGRAGGGGTPGSGSYISGTNILINATLAAGGGGGGGGGVGSASNYGLPGGSGGGGSNQNVADRNAGSGIIPQGTNGLHGQGSPAYGGGGGGYIFGGYDRSQIEQFPGGTSTLYQSTLPGYGTFTNFLNTLSAGVWVCGGGSGGGNSSDYSTKGSFGRPGVVVPPNRGMGGGSGSNGGTGIVAINVPKNYRIDWGNGLIRPNIHTMTNITQYVFFGGFDGIFFRRN